MKKTRKWGRSAPEKPSEEAKERQPPEQVKRPIRLTSRGRNYVACVLFPDKSAYEAGNKVAHDIASNPELRMAMYEAGYRRRANNYTTEQIIILLRHYGKISPTP